MLLGNKTHQNYIIVVRAPDTGGAIYKPETKNVHRESLCYVSVVGHGQGQTSRCPENPSVLADRPGLILCIYYYFLNLFFLTYPLFGFWVFQQNVIYFLCISDFRLPATTNFKKKLSLFNTNLAFLDPDFKFPLSGQRYCKSFYYLFTNIIIYVILSHRKLLSASLR